MPAAEFKARLLAITPHVFVTYILVALNVAVYLAMLAKGVNATDPGIEALIRWGADFGPRTITQGEWWRMLTNTFLHIGFIHLAFNMFVLWQVGPFVERLLGNIGFLIVYLISGLGGALVSLAWNPYLVSAGASGAIFGLYGALLGFIVLRHQTIPVQVLSPLTRSAVVFIGYNLIYGFIRTGTDVAAHLGGLATGFLCGMVVSVPIVANPLPSRMLRNAALAVGGAAVVIASAFLLPRPADFQAAVQAFGDVEKKVLATYTGAVNQARQGQLSDDKFADLLDHNVLPPWTAAQHNLAAIKGLPPRLQHIVSQVLEYAGARQQAWTLLAKGLRTHDITLARQANQKQIEAERLAKQVGSQ